MRNKNCNRKFHLIMYAAGLVLIFNLATGCTDQKPDGKQRNYQKKIIDAVGREVMIPPKVERVVDLALLDGTRTMVELGVSDKLAGVNDVVKNFMYGEEGRALSCWFAPPRVEPRLKDLLSVGGCREPNIELMKSLKPDIILAYASHAELAEALEEQTGLPVVCIKSSGCLDFKMIRLVADIMGRQKRAEDLISYSRKKIERIIKITSQLPETKRVNVFFWGWPVQDSPKTIAPYDPIDLAGGINVAMQAKIKPYEIYDITKEQLAVWNPDVILLQWWTPQTIGVRIETILSDPALQTVSAVKKTAGVLLSKFHERMGPCHGIV